MWKTSSWRVLLFERTPTLEEWKPKSKLPFGTPSPFALCVDRRIRRHNLFVLRVRGTTLKSKFIGQLYSLQLEAKGATETSSHPPSERVRAAWESACVVGLVLIEPPALGMCQNRGTPSKWWLGNPPHPAGVWAPLAVAPEKQPGARSHIFKGGNSESTRAFDCPENGFRIQNHWVKGEF